MKCKICKDIASIALPRHNTAFCNKHFIEFFYNQVKKAISQFKMFNHKQKILVCVSGGKDSLTLWEVLIKLGYNADGLYIDLGIERYSEKSKRMVEKMAEKLNKKLIVIDFGKQYAPVNIIAKKARRTECSACGIIKRYFFNTVAIEKNYDVVVTGHNLDDEAARLLGNILRWNLPFISKQYPLLEEEEGLKKKVKPLFRLTEQEIAAYAFLNKIEYIKDECPMSRFSTTLLYKKVLNIIEIDSPGTKHFFYLEFLRNKDIFKENTNQLFSQKCKICGYISKTQICSFCRLISYLEPKSILQI